MSSEYIPSIGIETHVQLKTKTKLFSAVGNDARQAPPNSLISHIDAGFPGALPVLNQKAVELSVRAGLALGGQIQSFSKFDRKHYFYPDLPKGYQISQYEEPLIVGGQVDIEADGQKMVVGLIRTHLEEDAGKNIHPPGADYSLVDLNRAGTPLLEIVSQPDIHSPAAAKAYAREVYLLMKYADVSDCDMYHGNLRFDINVSVSDDPAKKGIRSEVKNLNSFRSVENAAAYEIKRQIDLLKSGKTLEQETRGWDEAKQKTTAQRGKEEAHDYRYMPEPDIPPLELSSDFVDQIKAAMPMLPAEYRKQFEKIDIDKKVVEHILDSQEYTKLVAIILEKSNAEHARRVAFWFDQASVGEEDYASFDKGNYKPHFPAEAYIKLSEMVSEKRLNSTTAKLVFAELLKAGGDPEDIAVSKGLVQISDESAIEQIVDEVIAGNLQAAADVKAGQEKAVGFLIGQVMAKSSGQANPTLARDIILRKLKS